MTVPQLRVLIAYPIREALQADTRDHLLNTARRWMTRTVTARLDHWKRHKRLPPSTIPTPSGEIQ